MGWVYLISDTEDYKVGVSNNVEKRIKTLQTGNKKRLDVIVKFETNTPYKLEHWLHRTYQPYKNNRLGEWFSLPDEIANDFNNTCIKIQNNINYLLENNFFYK